MSILKKNLFLRFGQPIFNSTRIDNNMFHAIEQPLKFVECIYQKLMYLAYRINGNAFTKDDVEKINTSTFNIIHSVFTLCLAHCFQKTHPMDVLKKI